MQRRHALRDDQWERIEDALPGKIEDPCRTCSEQGDILCTTHALSLHKNFHFQTWRLS
jgi:hypothetical protein